MVKQLVIVTRYFVPYEVVDSDAVYQMVREIQKLDKSIHIHIVTTDSKYKSNINDSTKYSNEVLNKLTIHKIAAKEIKTASTSARFISNLKEGYRLISRARSLKVKNVISLTNPPLIALWCSILLKKRNFFYWSFDLFPDALAADELISHNSRFYKLARWLTYKNAPSALISLGDYQYNYLCQKFGTEIPYIKLPCGIHNNISNTSPMPGWHNKQDIFIGYIGNIGRAHSLPFLLNVITLLANKIGVKLILSLYGFHKDAVMSHIEKINGNNIIVLDYIDKANLNLIDVHLVSLKESWTNISVPSKAVSAVCSGSTLWFCGPTHSDTWGMFNDCSYRSTAEFKDVEDAFNRINKEDIGRKKNKTIEIKNNLLKTEYHAYSNIVDKLLM